MLGILHSGGGFMVRPLVAPARVKLTCIRQNAVMYAFVNASSIDQGASDEREG